VISRIAVLAVLLFLAACQGNDGGQQAAAPTTTTTPDPAVTACRETNMDIEARKSDPALEQLTLSRDSRIVAAATKVDSIIRDRETDSDPVPADLDLEYAEAVLELARACKAAGYL
jgi:type IV pilus biogenesis protein CpaD/CtpE